LQFRIDLSNNTITSWAALSQTQQWKSWSGYAFENICLNHIDKINKSLGISCVITNQYGFIVKATDISAGTQIDLILDGKDQVISLCEMKFYKEKYQLSKMDADNIRRKKSIFVHTTKTKKQIIIVLVTAFRLVHNKESLGLIDNVLDMNALF
jgi:hypothetical protein